MAYKWAGKLYRQKINNLNMKTNRWSILVTCSEHILENVLFDVFLTLFVYFDPWCIHLSSPEQESYSEDETDRSARTGDSEILKSSEIKGL